ncbi:PDR/VanB family oxidoreductase [Pseudomonas sp.]|uniref:PDR/VanB family oxidoreductase n=1 Tax=Pseudomonas sp. TaxID=306 RepID=UPI002637596C|nr:PDR/VanB family oxidoreductase [Pseudomonas sp.]
MLDVIINQKTREAEGVFRFELVRVDGSAMPAFTPGSHIDVFLPNGLIRQYSLCNHPEERHRYVIGVLEEPNSRGGSRTLHADIEVGQQLQISEPRNLFALDEHANKSLLFAGGIGITPILSMAQHLAQRGANFELHYCAREPERAGFMDELRQSPFTSHVHFHFDNGPAQQKLNAAQTLEAPIPGTHLYVCGPGGFMDYILNTAATQGWAPEQVHREYFAAPLIDTTADTAFEIELARSGKVLLIPADRSVFEVLDEAGIDIPVSCEQDVCGTCLTRVHSGEPDHRDQFLSAAEQARNDQFTPCCSRAKSSRLVLDL